ncbi:MAG: hypothetical protein QOI89_1904 [Solirubrobacteraceae bacterium]|jgi:hypothetical protein|nr:hypothetical protein [Solirubrobacteraceae bacterium]
MGLLDDAIREHLELKRRRGADAGEVAREQRDALEPVFPGQRSGAERDSAGGPQPDAADAADAVDDAALTAEEPSAGSSPDASEDEPEASIGASTVAQETVELDMQSVLDEDQHAPETPLPLQDSMEWEVPDGAGARARAPAEPGAGQRQPHDRAEHPEPDEHDEEMSDVPGDVPGQERLSFE